MTYREKLDSIRMRKVAAVGDTIKPVVNTVREGVIGGVNLMHVLAPMLGIGAGYGLSRMTSPEHITENADKELYSSALSTEIASLQRQLDSMKQEEQQSVTRPKHDQFV